MIAFGNDNNITLYVGSDEVLKAYLGDELVYPNTQPTPSYDTQYLTFEAIDNGTTFQFNKNGLEYSVNNGTTWNSLGASTNTPSLNTGDKIMFKGNLTITQGYGIGQFSSNGHFNIEGNPLSLIDDTYFADITDLTGMNQIFFQLFYGTDVVDASNLALPATILSQDCYTSMFENCRYLEAAPALPALKLADYCYQRMFYGCESLEAAPDLPALVATNGCYAYMFQGCSNLNYIKCMLSYVQYNPTSDWVTNVAPTGTFVKNTYSNWPTTGTNGIPTGWTEQTVISDNQLLKTVVEGGGNVEVAKNITNVTDIIIDGVSNGASTYCNLGTYGEHTLDFVLTNPTLIEENMLSSSSSSVSQSINIYKSVVIPEGVETIGSWFLAYSRNLISITIPDSVTYIGGAMLYKCTSFTDWIISPDAKLQTLRGNIFYGTYIEHIVIPKNVTSMGSGQGASIFNCQYLQDITIYATTPPTLTPTSGNNTHFTNCTMLHNIYVPAASVSAYQTDANWGQYSSIIQAIE